MAKIISKSKKICKKTKYCTLKQASKYLNISENVLLEKCESGKIKNARKSNYVWYIANIDIRRIKFKNQINMLVKGSITVATKSIKKAAPILKLAAKFVFSAGFISILVDLLLGLNILSTMLTDLNIINRIKPAKANEILIIVASFNYPNPEHNTSAENDIYDAISDELKTMDIPDIRLEISQQHFSTDDKSFDEVEKYAKNENASIIIWGQDRGTKVEVNFLNLRSDCSSIIYYELNETEKVQLADGEEFTHFINFDMPREFTFLSLYTIGQIYINAEEYEYAEEALTRAITSLPGGENQYHLTEKYIFDNNKEAFSELQKIIKKLEDEKNSIGLSAASNAYYQLSWLSDKNVNGQNYSMAYLEIALLYSPRNVGVINGIGWEKYMNGDISGAQEEFQKALDIDPTYYQTYANLGMVEEKYGHYNNAINLYTEALQIEKDPYILQYRSWMYRFINDYESAKKDILLAIEIDPGNSLWYAQASQVFKVLYDYEEALEYIEKAIELEPSNTNYYSLRGGILSDLKRYDEAIDSYNKALQDKPENTSVLSGRALTFFRNKDFEAAIKDYDLIYSIDPDSFYYHYLRGYSKFQIGDYLGAISDLTIDINNNPTPSTYYLRSLAYEKNGQLSLAQDDKKKYDELSKEAEK